MYKEYFECDKNEYVQIIKDSIVDYFEKINLDFDFKVKRIYNTTYEFAPIFCPLTLNTHLDTDVIYLNTKGYEYWNQVIYQLSHELTHCFIYCHNNSDDYKSSWIEETICEAISLYFLNYFYKNWEETELYKYNVIYKKYLKEYLDNILNQIGTRELSNSKNYDELMKIESSSQKKREQRKEEMKELYFKVTEKEIKGIINYRDYIIKDKKILDTEKYIKDFPDNNAVLFLCSLQNSILNKELVYDR